MKILILIIGLILSSASNAHTNWDYYKNDNTAQNACVAFNSQGGQSCITNKVSGGPSHCAYAGHRNTHSNGSGIHYFAYKTTASTCTDNEFCELNVGAGSTMNANGQCDPPPPSCNAPQSERPHPTTGEPTCACPQGSQYQSGTDTCEPVECPSGQIYEQITLQCESDPNYQCEAGADASSQPYSRVSYDTSGCVYECEYTYIVGGYGSTGGTSYSCTYTGAEYNGEPGEEPPENTDDFCSVRSDQGKCLDASDPDNQNDNGGCKQGTQFGYFGSGDNMEPICAPSSGGNEQDSGKPDTDGDGIPDEDDDDIDGDGTPNADDVDENGDGKPDKSDIDGDGVPDSKDADIDGDGIPNGSDSDIDGDGIPNEDDLTPYGDGMAGQDGKGKSEGIATDCTKKPASTGDKQLAAIHMQLWISQCQGRETVGDGHADKLKGDVDGVGQSLLNTYGDSVVESLESQESGSPVDGVSEPGAMQTFLSSIIPAPTSCNAIVMPMPIGNLTLQCDKFNEFKIIFGWALSLLTAYAIFGIATGKTESKD